MTKEQFKQIPLAEIHESPHNPRRHFHDETMLELADSIRKVGVITPALVRPRPDGGFELAAGHRRFRASKEAGQPTLPCLIREMDDQTFLEVLTIENLQREDVHPLDEAKGYEALMAAPYAMPVETIAARVGKSVKYVYDRVKLLALCPEGQELFWAGRITPGHAILLARLSTKEQVRCIDPADGGLLRAEGVLYRDDEREPSGLYPDFAAVSVRELDDWIKRHVRFDHAQPDAMLYPETASALETARTGRRKIVEITREYLASDDVRSASTQRVFGERAWRRADGKEDSKTCDYAVLGVIASGGDRGETFDVCIRKDKCRIHWGAELKQKEKAAKSGLGKAVATLVSKQEAKRQAEEEERKRRAARWAQALPDILTAAAAQVRKSPVKTTGYLASIIVEEMRRWNHKKSIVDMVPRGKSAEELLRHAAWLTLSSAIEYEPRGVKILKMLKLDPEKLLKQVAPETKSEPSVKRKVARKTA